MSILNKEDVIQQLLEIVKSETKPAVGCTEPVAVALTVATAKKYFKGDVVKIDLKVSRNIYKNGKSVTIPNTTECGVHMAAALGEICGDSDAGLMVFKNVNQDHVIKAKALIENQVVSVTPVSDEDAVFVQVTLRGHEEEVIVTLRGSHTNIDQVVVNGKVILKGGLVKVNTESYSFFKALTLKDLRIIAEEIPSEKLAFIDDGIIMNKEAAYEGLKRNNGLHWGSSLLKLQEQGKIGKDSATTARILTAAGSDLRMGGGTCPIMTSGGSGNQGLCVILPIMVVAEDLGLDRDTLRRAVFLGHAVNNFVKKYTGKLSAICGCAIAAGIGAGAGVSWLLGGKDKEIQGTIHNMLANLTGMVCDGAKESCAIKLSTSAAEAIICAYLAQSGTIVPTKTGIIGNTAEGTIENLGLLCRDGFSRADDVMIAIACE
ncbi:L-cysteine desulfidase family protein [Clostridium tunisiense]|uniref:L-cysteine desulfidase family protein n=1 Tax=Clostridium tunisiense TaxID=219748 RepID=UPI0002E871F4|nr:L-serine ammonia-lyase, iron-sulfur-dependent, subunit alpha [Clostridium tunisiense]